VEDLDEIDLEDNDQDDFENNMKHLEEGGSHEEDNVDASK
jgi:hypothetical protein